MKTKTIVSLCVLALILAALACQIPGRSQPTSTADTVPPVEDTSEPTDAEPVLETETSTPTTPPIETPTDTEVPPVLLPVFSTPVIYTFEMFTPTRGWAVTQDQDHLLITEDGGVTWLEATPAGLGSLPSGYTTFGIRPFFLDESTAWFTPTSDGSGLLYHTQDGGSTWTSTTVPFDNARYHFLDINIGYALVDLGAGAGSHYVAIYRTLDGGASWTLAFTHEPGESKSLREGGAKNGITFRGVDHGWIGGSIPMDDYFYLFYTEDGGVTWGQETDISLPGIFASSMLDVWQPQFVSDTTAFLPVRAYTPGGSTELLICRSIDAGQTWSYQGTVEDGLAVDFFNLDEGWLAAKLALYHTLDGGLTWSTMTTAGIPAGEFFLKVNFVDSQHGWALTTPDDMAWDPLNLYRTTDGGTSWVLLLP
ncbi:MAG: hypothetical protein K0B06_12395 [Brevefilum sp.]|nr:hypothetical protein [Brevefilum sp.]